MAWAFVQNKIVIDRVGVNPKSVFLPEYAAGFVQAPDEVDCGWTYDGVAFAPPMPPSREEVLKKMSAESRALRDQRLVETDWTQAADVPQATKDKWSPYRQALRDVPQQAGFPENIVWPSKP